MRIAVAGGTGMVGALVVEGARRAGHDVVVISRGNGVDLLTGSGLAGALDGVEAVVDVANSGGTRGAAQFFGPATGALLRAGATAGVGHHVLLSIVGVDRVPMGYYAAKLEQEHLVAAGPLPWTVVRATQFHEFPLQLLRQVRGPVVPVPKVRSAPVAAREVADYLVELAQTGPRDGYAEEIAGPGTHEMPELAREVAQALGQRRLVLPLPLPGKVGRATRAGALLPAGPARIGKQSFGAWLAELRSAR